jgi:DNA-binding MarR family transcriptional regulator
MTQSHIHAVLMEECRDLGLSIPRFFVLTILDLVSGSGIALSALSREARVAPPRLTYALDALQSRGLVRRIQARDDGRVTLAQITPAGRTVLKKAIARLNKVNFGLSELPEKDAAAIAAALTPVVATAGLEPRDLGHVSGAGKGKSPLHDSGGS